MLDPKDWEPMSALPDKDTEDIMMLAARAVFAGTRENRVHGAGPSLSAVDAVRQAGVDRMHKILMII